MRLFDIKTGEPLDSGEQSTAHNETWNTLPECRRCGFCKVVNGVCRVCYLRQKYAQHVRNFNKRWPRTRAAS